MGHLFPERIRRVWGNEGATAGVECETARAGGRSWDLKENPRRLYGIAAGFSRGIGSPLGARELQGVPKTARRVVLGRDYTGESRELGVGAIGAAVLQNVTR